MRTRARRPGRGPRPGLVQCLADDLDVVGGGVRPGVAGAQHDHRALTAPVAGSVVDPGGQGVVAEPLLEGRCNALLVGVDIDQGGVDVDHQRTLRADSSRG